MARHRTPKPKAAVSGAMLRNPQRYRGGPRVGATRPLGLPYATMSDAERTHWNEMKANLPWLHSSHRVIVRLACVLQARMDAEKLGLTGMRTLVSVLAKLGATPVDEGSVVMPVNDDTDGGFNFGGPH